MTRIYREVKDFFSRDDKEVFCDLTGRSKVVVDFMRIIREKEKCYPLKKKT